MSFVINSYRYGNVGTPFDAAQWGGVSVGATSIAVSIALRPAAGQSITFVGAVMGGSAGTTSNLGAFNFNGALTGGSGASAIDGDLVLAPYCVGSTADRDLSMVTSGYTELFDLYQDGSVDTNLAFFYKFMSSSPDSSYELGPTGNAADAGAYGAYVFRGVDLTTPFDIAYNAASHVFSTNVAGNPNPPSIHPVTSGAAIVCIGGCASGTFTADMTSSDLTSFRVRREPDTNDAMVGIGYHIWTP